jgi:hypothetical protein
MESTIPKLLQLAHEGLVEVAAQDPLDGAGKPHVQVG